MKLVIYKKKSWLFYIKERKITDKKVGEKRKDFEKNMSVGF